MHFRQRIKKVQKIQKLHYDYTFSSISIDSESERKKKALKLLIQL